MTGLIAHPSRSLTGTTRVPGDKSISHRALILGAITVGCTRIRGLLDAEDVLATAAALQAMGAKIGPVEDYWEIHGRGVGGLAEPDRVLDLGNSGTGVRLLIGLAASHPFLTFFSGDDSLRHRPMRRVIDPLSTMGARFHCRSGNRLPLAVSGSDRLLPIVYRQPVASAQVKSAILLAGLNTAGRTTVIEPLPSRDHTERLLHHFGASVSIEDQGNGSRHVSITGPVELTPQEVTIPSDISSAAFPLVAALLIPDSEITLTNVGINPLRAGLLDSLREMGADLTLVNASEQGGEPVADIVARSSALHGVTVPASRAPSMIDEFPILAIAAAFARGTTRMEGLAELRVKESDRLAAMVEGLVTCGVDAVAGPDWLEIRGNGDRPRGDGTIAARLDHRIAMSFLVLGLAAHESVGIDDGATIATSFPRFVPLMNELGANIAANP